MHHGVDELRAAGIRSGAMAAALAVVLLVSGCSGLSPESGSTRAPAPGTPAVKSGSGELRQDTEPLTSRFPQLGALTSATWMSGVLGDPDAPGPSTYWIDAVIELPQEEYDALRDLYSTAGPSSAPAVHESLRSSLPTGPLLESDELDAEFSLGEFHSDVWLSDASRSLVLVTVFQ